MRRLIVLFAILPLASGCILAVSAPQAPPDVEPMPEPQSAPQPVPSPAPAMEAEAEPDVPPLPLEIHWVRNSAEYIAAFEQTYRFAAQALERRAAGREAGTWAVVMDADETLISNSLQSKERALENNPGYFPEAWDEWVNRREAPALPGAKQFAERVYELGGKIAVVTNRREKHCPQTAENLEMQGIPFDVVLCRGEDRDKQPRWTRVEEGTATPELPPLEIVMWVGDNIHDFPGADQAMRFSSPDAFSAFGDRFIVLPNPLYGSWEGNPQD